LNDSYRFGGWLLQQIINKKLSNTKSLKPIVSENARILILGTMPSEISLKKGQYYANPKNQFWKIIYDVFEKKIEDRYEDRIKFIKKHCIALWDVLKSCERKGSADSKIQNMILNNCKIFYKKGPNIKSIIFNGKKAETLFDKHCEKCENLQYHCLPSTSSANIRLTYEKNWNDGRLLNNLLASEKRDHEGR